jgi:heat shock protein HslJ
MQHRSTLPRLLATSLVVVLALSATACGGDDDDDGTDGAGAGTEDTGAPATADDLEAGPWQLRSYAGDASEDLTAASEAVAAITTFDGTRVSGSTGCNQFNGPYELGDDGEIAFGALVSTQMACEPDLMAQEQAFLSALETATRAVVADDALQMLNGAGDTVLVFEEPEHAALEGASWMLLNYRTPSAVTSSILGADITAQFEASTLSGNAGCNDFTASYTGGSGTTGDLTITAVELGDAACAEPAGIAVQEQAFAAALATVVGFEIVGDRLTLLDAQGRDAAQFESS